MTEIHLHSDLTRWRRPFFWLLLAGLVLIFPLFFIGGPAWNDGPLFREAWNLGHPIFFGLLTLAVRPWRLLTGWKLWGVTSAIVLVLGLGIEFAQTFTARYIDGRDMFRNLTGLWAALALQPYVGFLKPFPVRDWLIRILAVGLLALDPVSLAQIARQQIQISQQLPDLYNFTRDHPEQFWRGAVSRISGKDCGVTTENALAIGITSDPYSGASLHNLPSDWRGYDQLNMTVWNPQDHAISLTLRINDLAHEQDSGEYVDRFNRSFQITPGINRISQNLNDVATAPKDRGMDMNNVRRLMLFTSDVTQPGHICLSQLRLQITQ